MKKKLKQIIRYQEADHIIISYPKSGRTWLRMQVGLYLLESLKKQGKLNDRLSDNPLNTSELSKAFGLGVVIWDHSGSELIDKDAINRTSFRKFLMRNKKKLFLIRDPKDVMVSSFFQATKRVNVYQKDIASFIRDEDYGIKRWIKLHNVWNNDIQNGKSLQVVRYEDMKKNPAEMLSFVLSNIGVKNLDLKILGDAIEGADFKNMKKIEKEDSSNSKRLKPGNKHDSESFKVRKGKVGDYREYLSDSDIEYIDQSLHENNCEVYFKLYGNS